MTTKELEAVQRVLDKIKRPNPFADEAAAYVKKDLAIREQQRKDMREMNRGDYDYREYPW
jgi:hypothetical protein